MAGRTTFASTRLGVAVLGCGVPVNVSVTVSFAVSAAF